MIAEIAAAVFAVLAGLAGVIAWFYRRGRQEQSLADSIDRQAEATTRNTDATVELAAQVGGLRETLLGQAQTLTEHHCRIKALEDAK